jgi:acetyl esterase/lipase
MIVYVPEPVDDNGDGRDGAVILHVNNGGWFASPVRDVIPDGAALSATSDEDRFGKALADGHVVISLGTRGRGALAADGSFAGKAPAAVVDAKAAIRYLRLNDAVMPGSAERIVVTGTSGGGGLSAVVAASGNSPDYLAYLAEIGAAGIDASGASTLRDDVFATIAYCPITDLGNADRAYEWQFGALRTDANTGGGLSDRLSSASQTLAAAYPGYLDGLGLTLADGSPLSAGTMPEAIVAALTAEAETVAAAGTSIPAIGEPFQITARGGTRAVPNTWLSMSDGEVERIDYEAFLRFVAELTPLKTVPAFDTTANTGHEGDAGENTLFGPAGLPYANFTDFGWNGNEVPGDGSGPDDTGLDFAAYVAGEGRELASQIALIDPLRYLGTEADSAPYWYVRHGMIDRDTAFAVPVTLAHAAMNDASVRDVNFALAWMQPHSGNYDVLEAYAWLARALEAAGPPER